MKKIYTLLLLILIIPSVAMNYDEVPIPTGGNRVVDQAQVLGPEYIALLENISTRLEADTSIELAVVTVDNLGGTYIEDFANRLFGRYGIGKKEKDNGVLILLARDDRKIRIEIGYGLEGVMTDLKSGQFLDEFAIPYLKEGQIGRALFELSRNVATYLAKADGKTLAISDPETWPAQIEPPAASIEEDTKTESQKISFENITGLYFLVFGGLTLLGLLYVSSRVKLKKARAAKLRALGSGVATPLLLWLFGGIASIVIANIYDSSWSIFLTYLGAGAGGTFLQQIVRRNLKKYIESYQCECPKCKTKMNMLSESEDDKLLEVEELAEERAEGMDYEFWRCPECEYIERFDVKLGKATKCKKCKRRTLKKTVNVLQAATTSSSGREQVIQKCHNPKCDFFHSYTRTIPKKGSSSSSFSSGSSSSSSSGSSFGGGSSGGGGASRGW